MIIIYLIKSTLCLGILFGFYKIALESKAMHQFKRFYLLASLIFAFTIPLVTFTYETEPIITPILQEFSQPIYTEPVLPVAVATEVDYTDTILWSIYGLGVLIFGVRFLLNLVRLKRKINTAETFQERDFTLALLCKTIVPHSFFKWIFLNKIEYLDKQIAPEVIAHEATHVRQKHSVDILFIEFLQVIFWFNPLIWLSKVSIKLNHEFLADQGAIEDRSNIAIYQNILLSYASSTHHTALESPFNYSLTKKRILMLSQSFSKRKVVLRALLLIPVVATCAVVFNQAIIAKEKLAPEIPILGEWIDQEAEYTFITIFNENDSLWANLQGSKLLVLEDNNGYYLENKNFNGDGDYYLSVNDNGELKFGDYPRTLIPISKSVMRAVQGEWQNKEAKTTYIFSIGGGIVCDIIEDGKKPVRYWPNLKDGGVTFTMGNDWVSFKREGDYLLFTNKNKEVEVLERSKLTALNIDIEFLKENLILINSKEVTLSSLPIVLNRIHTHLTKEQREKVVNIHITPSEFLSMDKLNAIKPILNEYGYFKIHSPNKKTFQARSSQESTYATQFIEGAKRNGKNAIVIEVKNDSIYVNGTYTSIKDLRKTIDAATANWSKEEYADPMRSIIFKGNTEAFIQRAEKEFQKTALYRANTSLRLIPPPPAPPSPAVIGTPPPPPPPVSPKEHFVKMQKLGGVFFYEGEEISFDKAISLINQDGSLNIKTPYPYSNPPETYISKTSDFPQNKEATQEEIKTYNRLAKKYNANPTGKILQGEVTIMYEIYTKMTAKQKKNAETYPILPPPPPPPPVKVIKGVNNNDNNNPPPPALKRGVKSATQEELNVYKRLAKKYNANPTGNVLQGEVIIMYEIYTKMSAKQKKNAETYPILPPPPPPPPVKVIKGVNDGDKKNPPPPLKKGVKLGAYTPQNQLPKPTSANILSHLKVMNRHNATFIYEGKEVSFKEALKLARKDRFLDVTSHVDDENDNSVTYLKSKGWQVVFDEEYKLFRQENVTITYKGNVITEAEAKKLIFNKPRKIDMNILSQTKEEISVEFVDINIDNNFSNKAASQSSLSLFSKIEEYPEDNLSVEIPDNPSFTPSSVQTVSQNITFTEEHNKAIDSILATYNLTREDVEVKTTTLSKKEPTFDTYTLGSKSVSTGLTKDYSQERQITQSTSFPVKKNDYGISTTFTENISALDHYIEKIEKHASKNGTFELDGKRISKKEALIAIQYPYIGLEQDYTATPHNMVVKKDPITSTWDVFYNNKLLTEKEYYNLSKELNLTLKKLKDKTPTEKAAFTLEKI